MKILVTGGAGFIGTALADRLRARGHDVCLLDLRGKFRDRHASYETWDCDVRDLPALRAGTKSRFDGIFHLAAQSSARVSHEQPSLDIDTNLLGTWNVCELAESMGCRKLIFTSTMGVYGESGRPIPETHPPRPGSLYGINKLAAENVVRLKMPGERHTIFRLFNVYGPGQDYFDEKHGMAGIFLSQMLRGRSVQVTGSLERFRDFVFVNDVLDAFELALAGLGGETLNVGSGKKTTCSELLAAIARALGRSIQDYNISAGATHAGDVFGTVADASRLEGHSWRPKVALAEGLLAMADDARKVFHARGCLADGQG